MDSGVYKLHLFLIAALGFQGNWRAAVDAADAACALFAEDAYLLGYTAWAYAGSGQTAQAKAIQDRLAMRARRQYTPPLSLAVAHLHSDTETVFACLEKALEAHEPLLRFAVRLSPPFYGLHSDPRLQNVARRVGL
jgi:hypothetical protein